MKLHVIGHEACISHDPGPQHPERPDRYRAAREGLAILGDRVVYEDAEAASRDALLSVHDEAHLDFVERAARSHEWLDPDTWVGPGSLEAAARSAGAAIRAGVLARGGDVSFAIGRPPGHHASPSRPMGFCLFNNVALAAEHLSRAHRDRVAIVDFDVHHGNGTQDAFYARGDVLYVSTHQHPFYPGTGKIVEAGGGDGDGFNVNLPMPAGTGHAGYLELLEKAIAPAVDAFGPHAILVSAGFDAHARDPLGACRLTADSFHAVITRLRAITPRIACILEGGYDLEAIRRSSAACGAALLGEESPVAETALEGAHPWRTIADDVMRTHSSRWPMRR